MSSLAHLEAQNRECRSCLLRRSAAQVVVAEGQLSAQLVIIGEAPGSEEDRRGRPFVGPAGQLLSRILQAAEIQREDTYLTNLVKCRPPNNRDPQVSELDMCSGLWLAAQLRLLRPKVILTLGNLPTQHLLQTRQGMSQLRGKWFEYRHADGQGGTYQTLLMPMLHPAYLLRRDTREVGGPKSLTWRDIQDVAAVLRGERTPPITTRLDDQPRLL